MNIELPAIPAGVLILLAFFGTYATAALNGALAFVEKPWQKKAVSVSVSLVLTALVLVFYYLITGDVVPSWPVFALLAITVAAAAYSLVTKNSATALEQRIANTPND